MKKPKLSVIVCTYNGEKILRACLISLSCQSLSCEEYEVIIVDNNSIDNTQKIIKQFLSDHFNFRSVIETKQGLSNARNRGAKEARGKYVSYIDDDAKASSNWCEKIIESFESVIPVPIAIGGPIFPYFTFSDFPKWYNDKLEIRTWGKEKHFLRPHDRFFAGSNMSFEKDVIIRNRGFSSQHGVMGDTFKPGEEGEFYDRIKKTEKGIPYYNPEIIVYHIVLEKNLTIKAKLARGRASGVQNFIDNQEQKAKLFIFSITRLIYYILNLLLLLLRFKIDYKIILSLQKLISKWTTLKLIMST